MAKKRNVGVMVESFRLGVKDGIRKAAELGADGVQIYVTRGEMAPENMDKSARAAFKAFVASQGLVISALCADYGKGFLNPATNPEYVDKTKRCMDLAVDLGTAVVTTHIGHVPANRADAQWQTGIAALTELAQHGDKVGVCFATETGPESADVLVTFLKEIQAHSAKVNYDPANLCMWGFDQLGGVKVLKDYIVHTHAKDGKKGQMKEMPLGEGDVNLVAWVSALDAIGYKGFLTIEREVGDNPVADISKAIGYLRTL
jgi:L-ribulose-5-phosphate 3-epimerase